MRSLIVAGLLIINVVGAQVIINEYVEGSGNNKALEFLNVAEGTVDLGNCYIDVYFNGKREADLTIRLTGTLESGALHVLFHEEGDDLSSLAADRWQSGGFGWFNGNDAIVLTCGNRIVDSIGEIGDDSTWGRDVTLRRTNLTPDVDPGDAWLVDPARWDEFEQNTFDGLGEP